MNTVGHCQLIYGFIQTQHRIKSLYLFLSLSCTSHIVLIMDLCPGKCSMPYFHKWLPALHSSCKQPLSALEGISFHTVAHRTHPFVTAVSHPPPAITLSPRYVNSLLQFSLHHITSLPPPLPVTVLASSHIFSSSSTASPIFPPGKNFLRTLQSPFSLQRIFYRNVIWSKANFGMELNCISLTVF